MVAAFSHWQLTIPSFLPSVLPSFLHVCSGINQSLSIQVTWSLSANQRPVSWSHDYCQPIRDQYPGHIITFVQSEASILVTWSWSLSTNQRLVSMSNDHSQLSRGKYPGHMITLNQSEASILVTWSLSTNQRKVLSLCPPWWGQGRVLQLIVSLWCWRLSSVQAGPGPLKIDPSFIIFTFSTIHTGPGLVIFLLHRPVR